MKTTNQKIRWGMGSTDQLKALTRALEPKRTIRETARMMGISRGAVFHIEKSALLKIIDAVKQFYREEKKT